MGRVIAVRAVTLFVFASALLCWGRKEVASQQVTPDKPAIAPKAKSRGFQWAPRKDAVVPKSGKRNHAFFVGEPVAFELGGAAKRYVVRDYWGEIVDEGQAAAKIHLKVKAPGWYKLYVYGKPAASPKKGDPLDDLLDDKKKASPEQESERAARALWGDIVGGTTFVIFRPDPRFPSLSPEDAASALGGPADEVMRGITGMGPQRHSADASKPDLSIMKLEADIAIDKKLYLPFDPACKLVLLIAFGNGTKDLDGVRKIVEHFKDVVEYWEPRNEPNFGSGGADFAIKELKPFYETVKSVSPKLKVIGPGTVSINPHLQPWLEDFFKAGGGKWLDGFSFHAYNCINGDVALARTALDSLNALLKKHGMDHLEKWQTEQGFFACVYGSYQPRLQGRWTMVQMMVYEQYGIPKEHNHLWYDRSHGYWQIPTWWENNDGGLNPAAPLMRVWSEELFGTRFARPFDFGPVGNQLYVGSLFEGEGKRVAVFQSAGSTDGKVELRVRGDGPLHVVSAFGVEEDLPVKEGRAILSTPELPVYVELSRGQSLEVVPLDCGPNLARADGVTAAASGSPEHPANKPETPKAKHIVNDIGKIINGQMENWYWAQKPDDQPWLSNVVQFPAWVEIQLPKPASVARVIVYAAPPWQWQGSLLNYELQYESDGSWVTIERVDEPAKVFPVFTPSTHTTVDSFYSDRWIFQHQFPAVTTQKIRLLVHEATWGGGATQRVVEAGGQTGMHQVMLREVELYGK